MSGRFLLDTNIVIAIFASDAAVQIRIADAAEVFVPVVGELCYGAHKSIQMGRFTCPGRIISRAREDLSL